MISRQLGGRLIALVALPLIVLCAVTLLLSAGEQVDQAILQRLLLGAFILCVVWSALVGADLMRAMRSALAASDRSDDPDRSSSSDRLFSGRSNKTKQDLPDAVEEPVELQATRTSNEEFDRQAEAIEALQQDEEDPDRLQQLFSLDQSLAKLRRAARGLATMTDPLTVDHHPPTDAASSVALLDVLTSGLGSVEHFERVQIGPVADLICTGELGEDLSHLISELIDVSSSDLPPDQPIELAAGLSSKSDKLLVQILDSGSAPLEHLQRTNHLFSNPLEPIDDPSQVGLAIASRLALRMQGSLLAERGRDGRTLTTVALDATLFPPRPDGQRPPLGPGPRQPTDPSDGNDQSPPRPTTNDDHQAPGFEDPSVEDPSVEDLAFEDPASENGDENPEPGQSQAKDRPVPPESAQEQRPDLAPPSTLREALAGTEDFEASIQALLDDDPQATSPADSESKEPEAGGSDLGESSEQAERAADEVRSRLTSYRKGLEAGRKSGDRPDSERSGSDQPGSGTESASDAPRPKYPKPQRGPRPTDPAQTPQLPDEEES